jgi:hypothetical protein
MGAVGDIVFSHINKTFTAIDFTSHFVPKVYQLILQKTA